MVIGWALFVLTVMALMFVIGYSIGGLRATLKYLKNPKLLREERIYYEKHGVKFRPEVVGSFWARGD